MFLIGLKLLSGIVILQLHHFREERMAFTTKEGEEFQKSGATSAMAKKVAERKGCSSNEINGKMIFAMAKEGDEIKKSKSSWYAW